jgi:hypothetical protein
VKPPETDEYLRAQINDVRRWYVGGPPTSQREAAWSASSRPRRYTLLPQELADGERWNGHRWSVQPSPRVPASALSRLNDLTASSWSK